MQYTDQMGNVIDLPTVPKRIISIVPSQTELLFYLGLDNEVIGITKFCVHPKSWFKEKERVGGTKTLNLEKIEALKPDLIIANKEENDQSQVKNLQQEFPVWISDIKNLEQNNAMISSIGSMLNREAKAADLLNEISVSLSKVEKFNSPKKVLYLIWNDPMMAAGKGTFINFLMEDICGLQNLIRVERYPNVSIDDLSQFNPDIIFLSSEPFPFEEKHIAAFQDYAKKVCLVDGEFFSWYGSRLIQAGPYFQALIRSVSQ